MPGQAACARRPVSSRRRGRSVSGEPNGLTGEHVCQGGPHPTDGPLWPVRRSAWTGRGVVERRRPERDGGAGSGAGDACRCGRCRHFVSRLLIQAITRPVVDKRFTGAGSSRITVRSTEAPAIVTRMGRDCFAGSVRRAGTIWTPFDREGRRRIERQPKATPNRDWPRIPAAGPRAEGDAGMATLDQRQGMALRPLLIPPFPQGARRARPPLLALDKSTKG